MHNITIIAALDMGMAIGKGGDIPWRGKLPADMDHFKRATIGKVVVMGRKTYESIPARYRPLPDRWNVVMTNHYRDPSPPYAVIRSVEDVLSISAITEVCIIGGAEIYRLFLPHTRRMLLTHVETRIDGDVFFPEISSEWKPRLISEHCVDGRNKLPFSIVEWTR